MPNAKRLGNEDVYQAAFRRLSALASDGTDDLLVRQFHARLAAYEETFAPKHGRQVRRAYTRPKLRGQGVVQTLTDWALHPASRPTLIAIFLYCSSRAHTKAPILLTYYTSYPSLWTKS